MTPDKQGWNFNRRSYHYYGRYQWIPLSSALRDELCSDEARARGLLRIYAWFSMTGGDFDALHDLIVEHQGKIGLREVLECLRDTWPSFEDISEWAMWITPENALALVEGARVYLVEVERLTNRMESFFRAEGELDESAQEEFKAIRKYIEESGNVIDEYVSSIPR